MRLKLTYVTGRVILLDCDEYAIFKRKLWYKRKYNESVWSLSNILKIEEV